MNKNEAESLEPGEPRMTTGKPVGAVLSALRILRHLAESPEPLSSNRIAREVEINPSTCFNILKTLEHEGFIYCDPDTKRHRLGFMLLELPGGVMDNLGYRQMLHPYVEQVARNCEAVASLWVRSGYDRVVLVDTAEGGQSGLVKIVMPIGSRVPLLAGALGRCFAGYGGMPRAELRKLFQGLRMQKPLSFDEFMLEAQAAVRQGYAVDEGNYAQGVTTISSPILDRDSRPIMAISAVKLSATLDDKSIAWIGEQVAQAAAAARKATWTVNIG